MPFAPPNNLLLPLNRTQIEYCLLHILRDKDLFRYAQKHLKPEHFNPFTESYFRLIWASALAVAERNGGQFPVTGAQTTLAAEVFGRIETGGHELPPETAEYADKLVAWFWAFPADSLNPIYWQPQVQQLLIERTKNELSAVVREGNFDIVKELRDYHSRIAQIAKVGRPASNIVMFDETWMPQLIERVPTGMDWLDRFMDGGQSPEEVYTLMGPTGAGKSIFGMQLAVAVGRENFKRYLDSNGSSKRKLSVIFSWEMSTEQIMQRIIPHVARIHRPRFKIFAAGRGPLSSRGNLAEYEYADFAAEIAAVGGPANYDGETGRFEAAKRELKEYIAICDMGSSKPDDPLCGTRGMEELASTLTEFTNRGYEIGVVVIDHAKAACQRWLGARNYDNDSALRKLLGLFCNEARSQIAVPFHCPVWCFTQLSAVANKRAPTAKQHHADASECGTFSEFAWYAFALGTKDQANNLTMFDNAGKARDDVADQVPVVLHINDYLHMVDVSKQWSPNPSTRAFEPSESAARRASAAAARQPAAVPPGARSARDLGTGTIVARMGGE